MKVAAIIILIILIVLTIIASIKQRKLVLSRGVIILALIAIGIIYLTNLFGGNNPNQASNQIQAKAPPVTEAPYLLQTSSRAYYVAAFKDDPQYLTMTVFYFYDKKKWQRSDIPLPIDKKVVPYQISRRNIGG